MFVSLLGSISRRMYLLLALFIVGFIGVVAFQLAHTRQSLVDLKQMEIHSVVEAGISLLSVYEARVAAGEATLQQAQAEALQALSAMRYSTDDYLFVVNHDYVMLANANPTVVGTNMRDRVDSRGKRFIEEYTDGARLNGSIFTTFGFNPDNVEGEEVDKLTYVQNFAPWSWAVGTGVLQTDIETLFWQNVRDMAFAALGIIVAVSIAGWLLAQSLTRPLNRLRAQMDELAEGRLEISIDGIQRSDEIGDMARAVEIFRQNGLKVAQLTEAEAARIIADQEERTKVMGELQIAFGEVVDAAVHGDFSRRVPAEFPDAELNTLAKSVNNLVESVDRGISETQEVLGALANTDLTRRMQGDYRGAFARLQSDTNSVAEKLTEIVTQLRGTSGALKSATREILSGANDLSERTTRQAATIEETSASMDQLAQTVGENARKAADASDKAQAVSRSAEEGGEVMAQANVAMERITDSSARISNIIGMIDDIAFQTNLLALNASVEAARAGEAGKGFAVVAVEVRRLAQSSAEASSEIKGLIEQSVREVDSGSRLVASASGKLASMLESLRTNTSLLDEIARASREQASSIDEVNTAVRQMDEMTQHNAALVEQVNASIEQTEAQASELDMVVDVFTLDANRVARHEAPAKPAPAQRPSAARALQQKARTATAYLTRGNTALKDDWSEF